MKIVQVKEGKLRGKLKKNINGIDYFSFTGIPFAAPPVGELRFKDPQPLTPWTDVRDATVNVGNVCAQMEKYPNEIIIGSEDCLYLNIYIPWPFSLLTPRAVMFWIHDGNFLTGTGNNTEIGPDYLIERNIILISINYRLGAFGFLNLGLEEANGNQGLKDQVAALKWVKENIAVFGGDPDNITVFGCGAGAVSAHLLTLSPLSGEFINKAILQSGVATMKWMILEEQAEVNSFKLASILGNDSKNPKEVLKFLGTISAVEIVKAQYKILTPQERRIGKLAFGPNIDKNANYSFLPRPIYELVNDECTPIMIGYTSDEYFKFLEDVNPETLDMLYKDLSCYLEKLAGPQTQLTINRFTYLLKKYYFNFDQFTLSHIPCIVKCMSDIHFKIAIQNFAIKRGETRALTYLYQFSYVGYEQIPLRRSLGNSDIFMTGLIGASHGDELMYLFYMHRYKTGHNTQAPVDGTSDYKILKILTHSWADFAKISRPTYVTLSENITWLPVTSNTIYFLNIDKDIRHSTIANYDTIRNEISNIINKIL